jgi:hypothetical protein
MAKVTRRSRAAQWLETLKDYDRSLRDASDARVIVELCEARDAHLRAMPPEAAAYGFPAQRASAQ